MSNLPDRDLIDAARDATKPHPHEMNGADICTGCGRTAQQIVRGKVGICESVPHMRLNRAWPWCA